LTAPDVTAIVSTSGNSLALGEIVMKIRPIIIGMVACLVLPLAGANARAGSNPGLYQAGAGADLERGVTHTAENFGRKENDDKDDHCDKGDHCHHCGDGDKDDKGDHCHHCDDGDHDDKRDHDDKGDHDHCEKSPSKPD
jgi:hypothetical protein